MLLRRPTNPILSPFVNCLWYFSGSRATRALAVPNGTTELVINLGSNHMQVFKNLEDDSAQSFSRSIICGIHSKYFVLDATTEAIVIGVNFKPGGALPFLRAPLSELADRHISLEEVWGVSATEGLRDRLSSLSPTVALLELERTLITRIEDEYCHHPAVSLALREFGRDPALARIREVSRATRYSDKRFIQLFTEAIGLGPKRFCRVLRLQMVINEIARGEKVDWAGLAASSGYYDQSHLIHDFRSMTGITPSQYDPVDRSSPNHVAL